MDSSPLNPGSRGSSRASRPSIRAGNSRERATVSSCFPEGELLNYLSGRRNPIRHKLYLPGYVNDANEPDILREFGREKPTAVVIWNRPTGEYGRGDLGSDYGRMISRWIDIHYAPLSSPIGAIGSSPPGRLFRTYRWK